MRPLSVLLCFAGFLVPSYGATRVTVDKLEQTLASSSKSSDADLARQLLNLELSERLSRTTYNRMQSALPGNQSRQALTILADESEFLEPPVSEVPVRPAPDLSEQHKILALTVNYVGQALKQLPNFFGTRVTASYEDTPAVTKLGASSLYQPIHLVHSSTVTVTFRDGHEVIDKNSLDPRIRTLTTSGVFGPILGTVLVDAGRSKLAWSHWEQASSGLRAVFRFDVPKSNSHYTITHEALPENCSTLPRTSSQVVAYHGEMAIDPASGTILRIILIADMKPEEFTVKSGIEVEYGEVSIGGKDYFLPTRSVTFSVAHTLQPHGGWGEGEGCLSLAVTPELKTSLNDVTFEKYHVFRSEATILTDGQASNSDRPISSATTRNDSR